MEPNDRGSQEGDGLSMAAVKKAITLPADLEARLAAWQARQAFKPSRSAVIQAALREFLDRKGVE